MADTMTPVPQLPNATTPLYITKITLPTGTTYEIVDENARKEITDVYTNITSISSTVNNMSKYTQFLGVTTTNITDGTTNAVVSIGGSNVTATTGSIVIYMTGSTTAGRKAQEFIYTGSTNGWQLFGDISATNLGNLAYKSQATSTSKVVTTATIANTQTAAITLTGSFSPEGSIALTTTSTTISLTSTTTDPNNNKYWELTPSGKVSVTYTTVNASASFIRTITPSQVITSLTTNNPTSANVTNGVNYTSVSNHNLNLYYLVAPTANAVTYTTSNAYTSTKSAQTTSTSAAFNGTTIYVAPLNIPVVTAASFSGTAGSVSVSGNQKIASLNTTTATITVE